MKGRERQQQYSGHTNSPLPSSPLEISFLGPFFAPLEISLSPPPPLSLLLPCFFNNDFVFSLIPLMRERERNKSPLAELEISMQISICISILSIFGVRRTFHQSPRCANSCHKMVFFFVFLFSYLLLLLFISLFISLVPQFMLF